MALLISDIVMPEMGGFALANEIRKLSPNLKILFMSGYPGEQIDSDDLSAPNTNFIRKPFGRDEFLRKVADLIDE